MTNVNRHPKLIAGFVAVLFILSFTIITTTLVLAAVVDAQPTPPSALDAIRGQPAYAINVIGNPLFEPREVAVPLNMTVIWFNNDLVRHSITTLSNKTYSPPQAINSGPIVQEGGSFIHQFTQPGRYVYFDKFNPSNHGIISVGLTVEPGKNFDMLVGGIKALPFDPNKAGNVVLSFVPKTVSFPPRIAMIYNVTLLDSNGKPIYSHTYDDSDGVLDLELVPLHKSSSSTASKNAIPTATERQFTTWGPDFIGNVIGAIRPDGVFHIRGPLLVENSQYSIKVSIVAKDGSSLQNPVTDVFALPPNLIK